MKQGEPDGTFSLPAPLAADYRILSCLKYSEQSAVYLLQERTTGRHVLLKTASDPLYARCLENEKRILETIHRQDFWIASMFCTPILLEQYGDTQYYLRTYIEGKTLEELCESNYKKPGLTVARALDCVICLTEQLQFLHALHPPLIHRDIKPQNVVLDANGIWHFIDLGISRFFTDQKRSDTLIMGTRLTAPPEQFGYQQTDTRSDLYSLGIVLFYCLTGEYAVTPENLCELDEPLAAVIRKATMFDPDKRYQTAGELLADLLDARFGSAWKRFDGAFPSPEQSGERSGESRRPKKTARDHKKRSKRTRALIFSAAVLFAAAAFWVAYRFSSGVWLNASQIYTTPSAKEEASRTDADAADSDRSAESALHAETATAAADSAKTGSTVYTFREPMIETAVRQLLDLPDRAITESDLARVTALHIMGLQIYSDDREIWFMGNYPYMRDDTMWESGLYLRQGTISSLEDVAHMPNLKTLCLYRQNIRDLSPLKDTAIEELGLGYNPLTDLSALRGNRSIRALNLSALSVSDTQILATMSALEQLNISATQISDLSGLERCPLQSLNVMDLDLDDYGQFRTLTALTTLELSHMNGTILSALSGMQLQDLSFHSSRSLLLDDFSVLPKLTRLFYCGDNASGIRMDAPNLPALTELYLVNTEVTDFHALASLPSLRTLHIYAADCLSYDGLDEIPSLRFVNCMEDQRKKICEQYPENEFLFP